ncbi:MAG: MepB family protein [Hyphomicrobiales bacterium]
MGNILFEQNLKHLTKNLFELCGYNVATPLIDAESSEYGAGTYIVNNRKIITRTAKITPKKVGQFVAIWQRDKNGITQPQHIEGEFDLMIINCQNGTQFGQFIFPKSALAKYGIIATETKRGKNGMRVYPPWDVAINKQAIKTQTWQLNYFLDISNNVDITRAQQLYAN